MSEHAFPGKEFCVCEIMGVCITNSVVEIKFAKNFGSIFANSFANLHIFEYLVRKIRILK